MEDVRRMITEEVRRVTKTTTDDTYRRKMREYYAANKVKIREQQKKYEQTTGAEKHECECGGRYTTKNKAKHLASQKHKEFIK